MTDRPENGPGESRDADERPTSIVVPGTSSEEPPDAVLASELQQARDLGSASRSCVAIIVVLLLVALVLCIFLLWATVFQ